MKIEGSENKVNNIELNSMEFESRLMLMFQKCSHMLYHRKGHQQGQTRILTILLKKGEMTQRELMNYTDIRSSSLSELMSKIEMDGYILREKCDDDRRNINISLTESGITAAKEQERNRKQSAKDLFSTLDDDEKKQLEKILPKLLTLWEKDIKSETDEEYGGKEIHHRHVHHGHMHHHKCGMDFK